MANEDMCLDAAKKAFPTNEKMRTAYMVGFNEGFDRAVEQTEVDLNAVVRIDNIVMALLNEGYNSGYKTRPFYEEVLRRFNEKKEK